MSETLSAACKELLPWGLEALAMFGSVFLLAAIVELSIYAIDKWAGTTYRTQPQHPSEPLITNPESDEDCPSNP